MDERDLADQLSHIDVDQHTAEVWATKDAAIRAVHDVTYLRTLRAVGIGPVAALLLTLVRAATD